MSAESQRQRISAELLQFIAAVVLHNAALAARLRLGVNDLQVLGLVQRAGRLTAGELARQTGLATGSITAVIDRLVKAGYATRERDEQHDRRKVFISADPAGIARINTHYEQYGKHLDTVLARRNLPDLTVIGNFFAELNAVDTLIAPPPPNQDRLLQGIEE